MMKNVYEMLRDVCFAAPAHARDHAIFIHRGHLGLAAFVGHALQGRVFRA